MLIFKKLLIKKYFILKNNLGSTRSLISTKAERNTLRTKKNLLLKSPID